MAIEIRTTVQGMTPEQAEAMMAQLKDKMATYPGFIAHASGPVEGGYHVTELWESQDAHAQWIREVIAPAMQQMPGGAPPFEHLPVDTLITR